MSVSPSSDWSAGRLARLDAHLRAAYIEPGLIPNALTLIHHKGQTVHLSVQGQADIERGVPLREDHLFRIYSMTKPITSVAFMMLLEEGRVALSDPVGRVIPGWDRLEVMTGGELGQFSTAPAGRPMQMVDLLRHTSGLSYFIQQGSALDAAYRQLGLGSRATLEEFIAGLGTLPLEYSPGEAWHYSAAATCWATWWVRWPACPSRTSCASAS